MNYDFAAMEAGRIEWWARASTNDGFVAQVQSVGGSTQIAGFAGFDVAGVFMYYDGANKVYAD